MTFVIVAFRPSGVNTSPKLQYGISPPVLAATSAIVDNTCFSFFLVLTSILTLSSASSGLIPLFKSFSLNLFNSLSVGIGL